MIAINAELMKKIISRFDRNAFESFLFKLAAQDSYSCNLKKLVDIDDRILDSYIPYRFGATVNAFFMCYCPYNVFEKFGTMNIDSFDLRNLVSKYISKRKYDDPFIPVEEASIGMYVINNFDSLIQH